MAYAPGVADRRGEIYAQGFANAGQSIGRGIEGYAAMMKEREMKREKDKELLARAKATETYIKSRPDLFGGEEKLADIIAVDPRESPAARAARLQGMMDNTIFDVKVKESQQREAEARQRAAMQEMQMRQMQEQQAKIQQMQQLAQYGQGIGTGVLRPDVQNRMQGQLQNPMMQQASQIAQATGGLPSPDMMARMGEKSAPKVPAEGKTKEGGVPYLYSPDTGAFQFVPQQNAGGAQSREGKMISDYNAALARGDEKGAEALRDAINKARKPTERILNPMDWMVAKSSVTSGGLSKEDADRLFGRNYAEYQTRVMSGTDEKPSASPQSGRFKIIEVK